MFYGHHMNRSRDFRSALLLSSSRSIRSPSVTVTRERSYQNKEEKALAVRALAYYTFTVSDFVSNYIMRRIAFSHVILQSIRQQRQFSVLMSNF